MRTRSLVPAIAAGVVLIGGAGIVGCSSSSGGGPNSSGPTGTVPVTAPATGSGAPASGTSSEAPPPTETFTSITKAAYQKLAVPLAKMPGVNNVTFYPKTHSLIVYYKNAATPKQHTAVEAAVQKQHGKVAPSPSPSN